MLAAVQGERAFERLPDAFLTVREHIGFVKRQRDMQHEGNENDIDDHGNGQFEWGNLSLRNP